MHLRDLPLADLDRLVQRYVEGTKISVLAKDTGASHDAVYSYLRRRGLSIRKDNWTANRRYTFNVHAFDAVDTPEKAYWLGMLYADGNNYEDRYSVSLGLAGGDGHHVGGFASLLGLEREIEWHHSKRERHQPMGIIVATDMHFSQQMARLGVMSNKTFKIEFPPNDTVPVPLRSHFVRGYMDGDGSICYEVRNKGSGQKPTFSVSFTGHRPFIQAVKQLLQKETGAKGTISTRNPEEPRIQSVVYTGNRKAQRVLDWIYRDDTVSLPRKRALYDLLLWANSQSRLRPMEQLALDGRLIARHGSSEEAARAVGGAVSSIRAHASGNAMRYSKKDGRCLGVKSTYLGYRWRYVEVPNPFVRFHEQYT